MLTAVYSSGTGRTTVTFDKPIVDQPLAAGNWVLGLSPSGSENASVAFVQLPDAVVAQFTAAQSVTDITYNATPPDVVGTNGLNVQPFTFPLTVV